jgi:hypothetical protein
MLSRDLLQWLGGKRKCRAGDYITAAAWKNVAIVTLLLALSSLAANASESPRPVFIHAVCDGKISSAVLSHLRDEIRISQKYQLIPTLDDNGRMDVVLTIEMTCADRDDVAAVATAYGKGKCVGPAICHGVFDASSLRADFCDSKAPAECGHTLFKAFEDYLSRPNSVHLKVE